MDLRNLYPDSLGLDPNSLDLNPNFVDLDVGSFGPLRTTIFTLEQPLINCQYTWVKVILKEGVNLGFVHHLALVFYFLL